jgi:hypothetical protein
LTEGSIGAIGSITYYLKHRIMKTQLRIRTLEDSFGREAMGGTCACERSSRVLFLKGEDL